MLSGRDLCVGPIPRPEESYRVWCAYVCVWGGVRVSLSLIERDNNLLHLECVGRRDQSEKIRKKERSKTMEILASKLTNGSCWLLELYSF